MKKFELTDDIKIFEGINLFRIKALINFENVEAGDLGGYVEKESNLSHNGNAWIYGDAQVYDDARVYGNARVCGDTRICGDAQVCGDTQIYENALICGDAVIYGNAEIGSDAQISSSGDYICIKGLGSYNRNTTFFKCKDDRIHVSCGCFSGSLDEFEAAVKETHSDSKFAKEYLAAVEVVKIHFDK